MLRYELGINSTKLFYGLDYFSSSVKTEGKMTWLDYKMIGRFKQKFTELLPNFAIALVIPDLPSS